MPAVALWIKKQKASIVFVIGIVIMLVAYYPSLFHAFRADTVTSVWQYAKKTGFFEAVVLMYSPTRDLAISGGDYTQFRPICFWLIGLEYWFFRYNFMVWQATGILLHGAVVFSLYRLLLKISKKSQDIVAALFASFFASLLISAELVIWQGCHSWLLLVLFVVLAMNNALTYIEGELRRRHLFLAFIFLLLTCFTSEVGMFLAFPLACYTFIASPKGKKMRTLWLFLPVFMYGLISLLDSSKASMQAGAEFSGILQNIWSLKTLYNFFIAVAWWLYAAFFPGSLRLELEGRLFEVEQIVDVICRFNWTSYPFQLGLAGVSLSAFILLKGFRKSASHRHCFFSGTVFVCMMAYTFVLIVVRVNLRGVESLNFGLYYSYLFWVICLVWIYSLIDINNLLKIHRYIRYLCAMIAVGLIIWNAVLVFSLNKWMAPSFTDNKKTVEMVNAFVELHKNEPDFSFYMPLDYPGNYPMPYVPNKHPWTCSFVESMFPKYFNGINPKYSFDR